MTFPGCCVAAAGGVSCACLLPLGSSEEVAPDVFGWSAGVGSGGCALVGWCFGSEGFVGVAGVSVGFVVAGVGVAVVVAGVVSGVFAAAFPRGVGYLHCPGIMECS